MANNTGLIIGVSVVGVAVVGVTIYLLTKKSSKDTTTSLRYPPYGSGGYTSGGFAPSNQRPPAGGYVPQAPVNEDAWWQNPLGQVGGNLANRLVDVIFKPRDGKKPDMGTASTDDMDMGDDNAYNYGYDTDPNFYGGYGEA
jgi:hypothetical protein